MTEALVMSTRESAGTVLPGDGVDWTPPSWDEVVREHADRVYRLAYRLTGNPHDADNGYRLSADNSYKADGNAYTDFLATLNDTSACFAGHCDWRVPTFAELLTLLTQPFGKCPVGPCIDPIFGPTSPDGAYVSSTTGTGPSQVLAMQFSDGAVVSVQKALSWFVRAVRDGPVAVAA